MDKIIYKVDDGSVMDEDCLLCWLSMFKMYHPECMDWDFDDITGGPEQFFELKDYYELKMFFEKNMG